MKKLFFLFFTFAAVFFTACNEHLEPEIPIINDLFVTVANNEGVPLPDVWIKLYYTDEKPDFVVDSAQTSVLGEALFKSLAPRVYLAKAFDVSGKELGSTKIAVEADEALTVVVFNWPLDTYVENYDFTVLLIDNRNQPIVGRKVGIYTNETNPVLIKEEITDNEGKIVFEKMVVGSYILYIYDDENVSIFKEEILKIESKTTSKTFVIQKIFHDSDIVITGFMSDPRGSDSPLPGAVSGDGFVHPGQYEFAQFVALRDIDFSKENFSVVFTNSSEPNHWGIGVSDPTTKKVYQINLEKGSVKKGQYFYVGGSSRMIASYYKLQGSPQLDESVFWGIDYANNPGGNGNGAPKQGSGLMPNGKGVVGLLAQSCSSPGGIAVFKGTHVDENTVPIDAIFYGTTNTFNVELVRLQIPDNDCYRRINSETGQPQPVFGVGSNTYLFPVPAQDVGVFIKLGGRVTPYEWIVPRTGTPILFNLKDYPGLSVMDIENSNDCTVFVDK